MGLTINNVARVKTNPATYSTLGGINVICYHVNIDIIVAAVKFQGAVDATAVALPDRSVI